MEPRDRLHLPRRRCDGLGAADRVGAVWPHSWIDSAPGHSSQAFAEGMHGVSIDLTNPCWPSDLDTGVVAILASQQARPRTAPPEPGDADPLKPASPRRWPLCVVGLMVVAYVSIAVFTAICAWRQPDSGMPVVLPVVVLGGWVILHPIVTSRLRRQRRR